jgi:hypothetical protein
MSTTGLKDAPCTAKIRPFPDDTEFVCHLDEHGTDMKHTATFTSRASQGVQQSIFWSENDRRTFRGDWVGCRTARHSVPNGSEQCTLPNEHRGNHAY